MDICMKFITFLNSPVYKQQWFVIIQEIDQDDVLFVKPYEQNLESMSYHRYYQYLKQDGRATCSMKIKMLNSKPIICHRPIASSM